MKQHTISELDREFAAVPILRADAVPSESEIVEASLKIGVPFSADYKQFLLRYGGAMVGPYPIFGLRPVKVMGDNRWSVVDVTAEYRRKRYPGAEDWAVISEDHAANPVGMDGNGMIWTFDHDFGGTWQLAKSFEEYVRARCLKLVGET